MWHNLLDVEDLVLEQLNLRKLVILKLMDGYFEEVIKTLHHISQADTLMVAVQVLAIWIVETTIPHFSILQNIPHWFCSISRNSMSQMK